MTNIEKEATQAYEQTGMWPLDMVARIRELEEALSVAVVHSANYELRKRLRATLNKP